MLICFSSRKGGSGKSTLLCSLAGLLALMGYEVLIIDYDPQGTAACWAEERTQIVDVPMVATLSAPSDSDLKKNLKHVEGKFDYILVDLPGVDSEDNRKKLQHADKIVFPFKPSQPDLNTLEAVRDMRDRLLKARPEVESYFVLNECPTTTMTERSEARAYFEHYNVPLLPGTVQARKVYRDSMSIGLSVCEMGNDKAKEEIVDLLAEVLGISVDEILQQVRDNRVQTRDASIQSSDVVTHS